MAESEALPPRLELARQWEQMMTWQLGATETPGDLGTIANLERRLRRDGHFIDQHDAALAKALGRPLPAGAGLATRYLGPARLLVPTVRTQLKKGEALRFRAIVLDNQPARVAKLFWRPLGRGAWRQVDLRHQARAVYTVSLPPASGDLEYYITARTTGGTRLTWPATAPAVCQTVIVTP